MVCGKGPSLGKKTKRELKAVEKPFRGSGIGGETRRIGRSIDREVRRFDEAMGLKEPKAEVEPISEQVGFTEEDKKRLRRRQSLAKTRLFTGLLSKGQVGRASLL